MRVQGVLADGVRVQEQQRVREREQQHEEQVPALGLGLGLEREPVRRHSLWLRWRGSKRSSSSIRQRSFSKLLRQRCANC